MVKYSLVLWSDDMKVCMAHEFSLHSEAKACYWKLKYQSLKDGADW